jgi:PAS domain S-box-containing protein
MAARRSGLGLRHWFQSPRFAPYSNGTRMSPMVAAGNPAEPVRADLAIAQPKLHQDEEELRRIVDLIPQQIVVLDSAGRAIFANQRALEYTGLSLDEVRAESFRERVFHPEDIERLREERQNALAGTTPFENEQRGRGRDGKYRWLLIRYMPLLENGRAVRWYAAATDIEDLKHAESKLSSGRAGTA